MKIATWNVNSVKVRLPHLLDYLKNAQPDVLCLQEIKCLADDFPRLEIATLGYKVEALGQRAYNGVALLSKEPARDIVYGLPGDDGDDHARYLEATFGPPGAEVRVASIYLPNGNPSDTEKFTYKLAWMDRLNAHAAGLLRREIPFVMAGDYNICPTDDDVYDPVGGMRRQQQVVDAYAFVAAPAAGLIVPIGVLMRVAVEHPIGVGETLIN